MNAEGERGGDGEHESQRGGTEGSATMTARTEIGGSTICFPLVACLRGERKKRGKKPHKAKRRGDRARAQAAPLRGMSHGERAPWGRGRGAARLWLSYLI